MANNTKPTETLADLRAEFDTLRSQVNELVQTMKAKSEEKTEKLEKKIVSELEQYQEKAEEKLHDAYDSGEANLKDLNHQIRKNPVTSLAVALSAGYVISKIMNHLND